MEKQDIKYKIIFSIKNMDQQIRELWSQAKFGSPFISPKILYAFNKTGEKFIVINDNSTIHRIMNERGQVFMVAHFRCKPDVDNQHYICDNQMHIISCTKHADQEDQYAKNVILPMVFK